MKYVLVGTGTISDTYVAAITALQVAGQITGDIVACVSRSGRKPASRPELPCFATLDAVSYVFDAVILATPNGLHCEGALQAALLKKHVLSEKLLAINSTQAEQMLRACAQAGVVLAVSFQRRTNPDIRAIKQLIDADAFGKIFAADLSVKCFRSQAYYDSGSYRGGWDIDGGGPFMQQAVHNLDIYGWFFGLPARVVSELGTFAHNIEVEDHGAALLRYGTETGCNNAGMIGTLVASTSTRPGFATRLDVHCDKGSFTLTDDVISAWHIDGIANPTNTQFHYKHNGAVSAAVADSSAHQAIIQDFEAAIATGAEPIASGKSAAVTTKLIEMVYSSRR